MAFLERAKPVHNLPVADQIMRQALALGGAAYRLAGREMPSPPELGPPRPPRQLRRCHYGIEEAPTGRDSATGRVTTHADHMFKAFLPCDACHAAGAPPPGIPDSLWIDTAMAGSSGNPAFLKKLRH